MTGNNHLQTLAATVVALGLCAAAPHAVASPELAKQQGCLGCHDVAKRVVGPSFAEVAKRQGSSTDAAARIAKAIHDGSRGAWGDFPMPPQPQVSATDALTLARWIQSSGKP